MIFWRTRDTRHRSCGKALPPALFLGFLSVLLSSGAGAQITEALEQRQADFNAARSAYEAARDAQEAMDLRFQRALQAADSAYLSGTQRLIDRAYSAAQQAARELEGLDRRVRETAEGLEEARDQLLEVLGIRIDELLLEAEETTDPDEAFRLASILRDLDNRYAELQALEPEIEVAVMPEMTADPRDSPQDLLRKARAMDYWGDRFENQLADLDARLEGLQLEQRRDRRLADFLAGIDRFDDTQVPVTVGRTGAETQRDPENLPPGADSVVAERPIEEKILDLEALRDRVAEMLRQVRGRADMFRRLAGGVWA
ncbi:hypothetical protein ACFL3S_11640 [Gemmatimonadota bacterium]